MLHWQVPKWLSRTSLVTRVIIGSSILHLLALIAIFVVYQGSSQFHITISGNMINPDSEIVFMLQPSLLQSSGGQSLRKSPKGRDSERAEKSKDVGGTTLVKIVQPKAKPKTKAKKEIAAKKKADAKKIESKPVPEKVEKKDSMSEKSSDKNEELKPAKLNAVEPVSQTPIPNEISNNSASSDATLGASDNNIVYVGQAEMDALQAQEYIQQELAQHWAPPSGMRADLFAIVTLTIDFEGLIKKVDLTTSSGNLLFDAAAKKAAAQITPARWTYGKELSITFKP